MDGHGNGCQAALRRKRQEGRRLADEQDEHRLGGTHRVLRRGSGVRVLRTSAELWLCGSAFCHYDPLRLGATAIWASAAGGFWPAASSWVWTRN